MRLPLLRQFIAVGVVTFFFLSGCGREPASAPPPPREPARPDQSLAPRPKPPPPPWRDLVLPTDQARLLDPDCPEAFMLTALNRPGSGHFGSVRTNSRGLAQFHEGVDIAPVRRDRHGEAMDEVRAVAAGVVGYVNAVAGNSSYGKYVVLLHRDPLGQVHTLYAHLASVAVRSGQAVQPGTVLGGMGHTSSSPFPRERAHLHFEVGLMANERYAIWYRAQQLKPDHGNFNGGNLLGVDPLAFLHWHEACPTGSFRDFLETRPAAFDLLVKPSRLPDFFRRYPALWKGATWRTGAAVVLSCTENGLPLGGRLATDAERRGAGSAKVAVLSVDPDVLGRNGSHLIVEGRGGWRLGSSGERWLAVLLF